MSMISKFLEGQQNQPRPDVINVNLQLSSSELKEIGNLLNKLRENKGE